MQHTYLVSIPATAYRQSNSFLFAGSTQRAKRCLVIELQRQDVKEGYKMHSFLLVVYESVFFFSNLDMLSGEQAEL